MASASRTTLGFNQPNPAHHAIEMRAQPAPQAALGTVEIPAQRRHAADAIIGTSAAALTASALSLASNIGPDSHRHGTRVASEVIFFAIVVPGLMACAYTHRGIAHGHPLSTQQRRYRNLIIAASAVGLTGLAFGVAGANYQNRTTEGALFGISMILTAVALGTAVGARHAASPARHAVAPQNP